MNLTWEVREGLLKHQTTYDQPGQRKGLFGKSPSLEAQIANLADELIYGSHDLDDGLEAGLLVGEKINARGAPFCRGRASVRREHGELPAETRRYFIIRCIIDLQVRDVVETSEAAIVASGVRTADDVRRQAAPVGAAQSEQRRGLNSELRVYLFQNLYFNPAVDGPNRRAGEMLARTVPLFCGASAGNWRVLAQTRPENGLASRHLRLPFRA